MRRVDQPFSSRVLSRLSQFEKAEENVSLRTDIRQASITISLAERGEHEPVIAARYRIRGLHPDAVFPAIMAMRRAKLGNEFSDWFDQAGNLKPDVPSTKPIPVREAEKSDCLPSLEHMAKVLTMAAKAA